MEFALLALTALSTLFSAVIAVVLLNTWRGERARSEARVALLRAAVAEAPGPEPDTRMEDPPVRAARGIFLSHETPAPHWRSAAAIAGTAGAIVLAGFALLPAREMASGSRPPAAPQLELLALEHAHGPGEFRVSGRVRNLQAGGTLSRIGVSALVFDRDGALIARGRADLDRSPLPPGDGAAFVIKVPVAGGVGRYRVGFHRPDGAPLTHLDRRPDGNASARIQEPTGGTSWGP